MSGMLANAWSGEKRTTPLGEKVKRLWPYLFVGGFILYIILSFPDFYPFPHITSQILAFILNQIGIYAFPHGNELIVDNLPILHISAECSGIILMSIFPLTIFLIPHFSAKQRMASLLFLPVLFLGNIVRILIDILVGLNFSVSALIFFHDSVGQILVFLWAIGAYFIWLKLFGNFPREKKAIHPWGYD